MRSLLPRPPLLVVLLVVVVLVELLLVLLVELPLLPVFRNANIFRVNPDMGLY